MKTKGEVFYGGGGNRSVVVESLGKRSFFLGMGGINLNFRKFDLKTLVSIIK